MPKVQVQLPDRLADELERLANSEEFLNREQAVEELLSMGLSAYDTGEETTEEPGEDVFSFEEETDPALDDEDSQDGGYMR